MTLEQKWSSHVQTAVASKPFESKIPETTQRSFEELSNRHQF